jgi:exodeoxyribonuclease VII large subunit
MWRSAAARNRFDLHDGLEVVASGPVEVYAARGTYQLIVERIIPQGVGALELAFRQLQEKLAAEGLFDPEHKRPLPRFPKRIALVTSPTGAAVRDILQVITRRWPVAEILVLPVPVQGEGAGRQIAAALRSVPSVPGVDLIITGRGGGSLEDLWAFNEEVVARAIFESPIPIICGVGHEIDVSIAELVSDRRALTPSEAAELAVPLRAEVVNELRTLEQRLGNSLRERARRARMYLEQIASRRVLTRPLQRIHDLTARLDELSARLRRTMSRSLEQHRRQLQSLGGALDALSPLKVLERGYSITIHSTSNQLVQQAAAVRIGDELQTTHRGGQIASRVTSIQDDPDALLIAFDELRRDTQQNTDQTDSETKT